MAELRFFVFCFFFFVCLFLFYFHCSCDFSILETTVNHTILFPVSSFYYLHSQLFDDIGHFYSIF